MSAVNSTDVASWLERSYCDRLWFVPSREGLYILNPDAYHHTLVPDVPPLAEVLTPSNALVLGVVASTDKVDRREFGARAALGAIGKILGLK